MIKRELRRLRQYDVDADYPSLDEHRAARRRFLSGSAVVLGAGALAAACGRPFFTGEHNEVAGGIEMPDYYTLRFPVTDDRAVYFIDGGYARFYVVALTWNEDCSLFAVDARERLTDLFAEDLAGRTVDELDTASGVVAVASQLRSQLNAAYELDTGEIPGDWFHDLELVLTQLDHGIAMGGVPPSAGYP